MFEACSYNDNAVHIYTKPKNVMWGKPLKRIVSYQHQSLRRSHFHRWSHHSHCLHHRPSVQGYTCQWNTGTDQWSKRECTVPHHCYPHSHHLLTQGAQKHKVRDLRNIASISWSDLMLISSPYKKAKWQGKNSILELDLISFVVPLMESESYSY